MKTPLAILLTALLLAAAWPVVAADWAPDPHDETQVKAAAEIDRMLKARPKLQKYFDEAYGYAIFPTVGRIAAGFGFVYGSGLVVEQGTLVGRTSQYKGALGFDYGAQLHSQIIFFQDEEIMNEFKTFGWEFDGRGSAVLIAAGASVDPGYKSRVAIFSRTKGGLMIELAVHAGKYFYWPLKTSESNESPNDSN
jgi:lipid-binding SYLF domain-containing protein